MLATNQLVSVFLLFSIFDGVLLKQIPDYIQKCKRDQSTINSCVKKAVEDMRPYLIAGIPELGVPSIDPFYIKEIKAPEHLKAVGRNIKVSGGSNFTIKNIAVDLDTMTLRARIRFPKLHLEGRYKLNTRVLVLTLEGQGNMVADAVKCDGDFTMYSRLDERDGKEYVTFTKLDANVNVKDYRIRLDGLFNGDKTLGDATNEAINQNRAEFLKTTKPYLEQAVSDVLLKTANMIVDGVALDDFFL